MDDYMAVLLCSGHERCIEDAYVMLWTSGLSCELSIYANKQGVSCVNVIYNV